MRADGEICVMAKPSESSVFAFVNPEMVMFVPAPSGTFGTRVAVMVFTASGYGVLCPIIFTKNCGSNTLSAAASPARDLFAIGIVVSSCTSVFAAISNA